MGEQSAQPYIVLARKYRPQIFAELKGQNALVQTLTNAIQTNRVHHAYVLTGIRGVGKTTTARIIAKALNCENGPAAEWAEDDASAIAIGKGNHVDVLEFDAASNRGVEEVQSLFEGVNYAPVQGRKKVYIIDEVHMLSKHAFNALLKTLEEPPAHVVFIFATTEVQKIPVTVLSRCQRFDLRRVNISVLQDHYDSILTQENLKAEPAALQAIAQAADGSVRDGLSLLDQAIALSSNDKQITLSTVNGMLGLGDRSKVADMLEEILNGDAAKVLAQLDDLHALGQDPLLLLTDLMTLTDTLTRLKIVPNLAESKTLSELERTRLAPLAEKLPLENLARLYQMLLHALTEAKTADRPMEAVSMAAIRITNLASLPPVAQLLKQAQAGTLPKVEETQAEPKPVKKNDLTAQTPVPPSGNKAEVVKSEQNDLTDENAGTTSALPEDCRQISAQTETQNLPKEAIKEERVKNSSQNTQENPPWEDKNTSQTTENKEKNLPNDIEGFLEEFTPQNPALGAVLTQKARVKTYSKDEITFSVDDTTFSHTDIVNKIKAFVEKTYNLSPNIEIVMEKQDKNTVKEVKTAKKKDEIAKISIEDDVAAALALFPGSEVVDVTENSN